MEVIMETLNANLERQTQFEAATSDGELRALSDEEVTDVSGGAFWVPFMIGAALGGYKAYRESKRPPHG
jgi:hypothetical protein